MPPKEINNPVLYLDGEPITGIIEITLPEIKGGPENEVSNMWENGRIVVCLQKLFKCRSGTRAGKEDKRHSKHIKLNSLYGLEHKKRNGKSVGHCRRIGGIRAWQKTEKGKRGN